MSPDSSASNSDWLDARDVRCPFRVDVDLVLPRPVGPGFCSTPPMIRSIPMHNESLINFDALNVNDLQRNLSFGPGITNVPIRHLQTVTQIPMANV
ncbi:MAG: hypothetical protein ABW185_24790 [Sedimenticola sp.]